MAAHTGIFIASPEYNASITPLLKNTLDWVSHVREPGPSGPEVFKTRVFALGSSSPGGMGGLKEFLRVISTHRANTVYIAPPIAVALAKHPIVDYYDLSCVENVLSGAAPLDAELGHAVAKRLGCQVRQGYGMTELSPVSHAIPRDQPGHGPQQRRGGAAEHRVQAGRPGDRRGGRPGRARRAVGARPERDGRLPEQPRGHRDHPRRRGLPAHRRRRRGHRGRRVLDRRPGQGADQVQGLPGAAGRAGGAAADPRRGSPTSR